MLAGILAGCADASPPQAEPKARPVFCYRTLADVGCYTELDPGRERRLTAIYMAEGEPWWVTFAAEQAAGPDGPDADGAGAAPGPLPLFPLSP